MFAFVGLSAVPWSTLLFLGVFLLNAATFLVYGFNKRAARIGRRRVPERTLLLLGLFGGSPGAFLAQQVFRHKISKLRFQLAFWGIFATQVLLVLWWEFGRPIS